MFFLIGCSYESVVNQTLPKYNDFTNVAFSILKIIIHTCLIFSLLFIQMFLAVKCLAYVSKKQSALEEITHLKINLSIVDFTNMSYKFCFVILCFSLIGEGFLLYLDKIEFDKKRQIYFEYIKNLFDNEFSTDFHGYNFCAESFLNYFCEDISFGLYYLVSYQYWLISIVLAVYSLMLFYKFHKISEQNPHLGKIEALKEDFIQKIQTLKEPITFIRFYGVNFVFLCAPVLFYILYNYKFINFLQKQSNEINKNIHTYLENHNDLNFNMEKLANTKQANDFSTSIESFRKIFMIVLLICVIIKILTRDDGTSAMEAAERPISINFNECAQYFTLLLFLYLNSVFADRLFNLKKTAPKILQTIAKIQILSTIPKINNKNTANAVEFNGLEMQFALEDKHYSGVRNTCSQHLSTNIKKQEKILIVYNQNHQFEMDLLRNALVDQKKQQRNGNFWLKARNEKIDITKISFFNWSRLVLLSNDFSLITGLSITKNFQNIIPNLTEKEVEKCLKLALANEITPDTLYSEHLPHNIKNKLIIAMVFALDKTKDLIVLDDNLFAFYSQQEFQDVLHQLLQINCALVIGLKLKTIPDYFFRIFHTIYNFNGENLLQTKDFSVL